MIDNRAFSKDRIDPPSQLPYVSRKALKRIKHPSRPPESCNYCGGGVELVDNSEIYRGTSYGEWPYAYLCRPCEAFVGLHPNTDIPLGSLANKELREARKKSKSIFHNLIKQNRWSRSEGYAKLAEMMGISQQQCHFGMFDLDACEKAARVLQSQGWF